MAVGKNFFLLRPPPPPPTVLCTGQANFAYPPGRRLRLCIPAHPVPPWRDPPVPLLWSTLHLAPWLDSSTASPGVASNLFNLFSQGTTLTQDLSWFSAILRYFSIIPTAFYKIIHQSGVTTRNIAWSEVKVKPFNDRIQFLAWFIMFASACEGCSPVEFFLFLTHTNTHTHTQHNSCCLSSCWECSRLSPQVVPDGSSTHL